MNCELVLCVGGGPALDLKWMPMGAWDDVSPFLVVVADGAG
jgi:transcription factor C subunit 6